MPAYQESKPYYKIFSQSQNPKNLLFTFGFYILSTITAQKEAQNRFNRE